MGKNTIINVSAAISAKFVIKNARAAVTLAIENKPLSGIPIYKYSGYNQSINIIKQKNDQ